MSLPQKEGNPYAGGSRTLSDGLIQPRSDAAGLQRLLYHRHWHRPFLGMTRGIFCPFSFGLGFLLRLLLYGPAHSIRLRGLGEIAQLLCFGPAIGLGAYYVQAQRISWEAFWGTLPFGIMLFSMITINEIPDYVEDRRGGKLNLVARFGRETGVWLFIVSLLSAYGAILTGVILGRIPVLGIDLFADASDCLQDDFHLEGSLSGTVKMAPANLGMICMP